MRIPTPTDLIPTRDSGIGWEHITVYGRAGSDDDAYHANVILNLIFREWGKENVSNFAFWMAAGRSMGVIGSDCWAEAED